MSDDADAQWDMNQDGEHEDGVPQEDGDVEHQEESPRRRGRDDDDGEMEDEEDEEEEEEEEEEEPSRKKRKVGSCLACSISTPLIERSL